MGRHYLLRGILAAIIVIPGQESKIVREWGSKEAVNVSCPDCGLSYHDLDTSHYKACWHVIYQKFDSRK